jgi:hypothetical protein
MASNLMEAEGLVAAIVQLKERAENAAREAETARSKADSESGFAFNAKNNSEEHAKAISQPDSVITPRAIPDFRLTAAAAPRSGGVTRWVRYGIALSTEESAWNSATDSPIYC